jgi:hypothetical protein
VAVLTDTGSKAKGFVSEEEKKKDEKDKKKGKQAPGGKGGESARSTKTGDKTGKGGDEVERANQEAPVFVVHLVQVTVGRDYGNEIEILTGLNQGDRVVVNPNDDVVDNARVRGFVQQPDSASQSGGQGSSNLEKMAPQPGGDAIPKDPSKEQKNRGPGQ